MTNVRLPSASKAALAELCAYPFTGPLPWPKEPESPAAQFGRAVHRCAEQYTMGRAYTIEDVAREFGVMARIEDLRLRDEDVRRLLDGDSFTWRDAEVCIAFHPLKRESRRADDRFDKRPGEMILIVDLMFEEEGSGQVVVRDLKTGKIKPERPAESAQMRLCGLASSLLLGVDECRVELAYVNGHGPLVLQDTLGPLELEECGTWISELIRELPSRTTPVSGPHCAGEWCPLNQVCEASTAPKKRSKAA